MCVCVCVSVHACMCMLVSCTLHPIKSATSISKADDFHVLSYFNRNTASLELEVGMGLSPSQHPAVYHSSCAIFLFLFFLVIHDSSIKFDLFI